MGKYQSIFICLGVASFIFLMIGASPQQDIANPLAIPTDTCSASAAMSQNEMARSTLLRRAVEAAIWGMPAVAMANLRKSLPSIGADFNQVIYFSEPINARHELLTADNNIPYVISVLDTHQGPIVLEIPPANDKIALYGSAIDSWEVPLVDVGSLGEDRGKGGKYLFLPPRYSESPPSGYKLVQSPTYYVHVALHPMMMEKGTWADAVTYSRRLKVYPLAQANKPQTKYIDANLLNWSTLPTYDASYFRDLAQVVNDEPAQEKDAVMLSLLASIGIEKGKIFNPSKQSIELFDQAADEAFEQMQDYFTTIGRGQRLIWPDRHWAEPNLSQKEEFNFVRNDKLLIDERAGGFAFFATWLPKKMHPSAYTMGLRDSAGQLLSGQKNYRLHIPSNVSANDFWSVIVYSLETKSMIANPFNRVGLSSHDKSKLQMNPDNSIDIYFGPQAPTDKTSNWIPTGENFFVIFRLYYSPTQAYDDKTWKLPDIEPM